MANKINKFFEEAANWICNVALLIIVILLMVVVIGRYFFNYTPSWGEELSLFCLTWVGLFSACIAEKHDTHIRLSFIDRYYPPIVLRICGIIRYFLKLGFFTLMLYYGIRIFATTRQKFASVDLSFKWQVLPGIFMAVFCLIFMFLKFKKVMTDTHERDKYLEEEALKSE